MRVNPLRRVDLNDERGASALIVVIALLVIFGMTVLVVDFGNLLQVRRQMVTSADAAALAAAESFALGDSVCGGDESDASSHAVSVAQANGAVSTTIVTDCPAKTVTATVVSPLKNLVFARIIGGPSSRTVSATATAAWGSASAALGVVPLMITQQGLADCGILPDTPPPDSPVSCQLSYNSKDIGNATWGLMDLECWDVNPIAPDKPCNGQPASAVRDQIMNGWPSALGLNWPDPTYDGIDIGLTDSVWQLMNKPPPDGVQGTVLTFPVVDIATSVPPAPDINYFNVVGFRAMRVVGVVKKGSTLTLTLTWGGDPIIVGQCCDSSVTGGPQTISLIK